MPLLAALLLPMVLAAEDPLAALPPVPRPEAVAGAPTVAGEQLAPGLRIERGQRVTIDGTVVIDRGPADGLEVLACLQGGKTHESLIQVNFAQGAIIKAAAIAAFGLADGIPAAEGQGLPARGTPMRLRVAWTDAEGKPWTVDASSLIRDRTLDMVYPALPWIWTGSRFETVHHANPQGGSVAVEQFMLEVTRSIAVNFDEPDALLASPFPGSGTDDRFEVNRRICPVVGTPVRLLLEPAVLPVRLDLAADGSLSQGAVALDDAALTAILARFPADAPLRALLVRTGPDVDRTVDAAARLRLLRLAAAAKVWVVPVFSLR
jgi:hypothetical protein